MLYVYRGKQSHISPAPCISFLNQDGRWNDGPCNLTLPAICKKPGYVTEQGEEVLEDNLGCSKVSYLMQFLMDPKSKCSGSPLSVALQSIDHLNSLELLMYAPLH